MLDRLHRDGWAHRSTRPRASTVASPTVRSSISSQSGGSSQRVQRPASDGGIGRRTVRQATVRPSSATRPARDGRHDTERQRPESSARSDQHRAILDADRGHGEVPKRSSQVVGIDRGDHLDPDAPEHGCGPCRQPHRSGPHRHEGRSPIGTAHLLEPDPHPGCQLVATRPRRHHRPGQLPGGARRGPSPCPPGRNQVADRPGDAQGVGEIGVDGGGIQDVQHLGRFDLQSGHAGRDPCRPLTDHQPSPGSGRGDVRQGADRATQQVHRLRRGSHPWSVTCDRRGSSNRLPRAR